MAAAAGARPRRHSSRARRGILVAAAASFLALLERGGRQPEAFLSHDLHGGGAAAAAAAIARLDKYVPGGPPSRAIAHLDKYVPGCTGPPKAPAARPAAQTAVGRLRLVRRRSSAGRANAPAEGPAGGLVLLNIVTALFGCNQALIKTLETDDATAGAMDSSVVMALRFSIATVALGGFAFVGRLLKGDHADPEEGEGSATDPARPEHSRLAFAEGALELSIWLFLGFMTQAVGLQYTQASSGALLGSLTVVVVPLLSMLDGKKIGATSWASVGLAMIGITLFVGPGALEGADWGFGDALELASAFFFGVQMWRCEKLVRGLPASKLVDLTVWQLALVAVFSWVALLAQGISIPGTIEAMAAWPLDQWAQVAIMGLVTTAFCLWAETAALREVDAPVAALIYACEPLWGALFAFLWRGETLDGTLTVAGACLLFLASAAGAVSSGQQESTDAGEMWASPLQASGEDSIAAKGQPALPPSPRARSQDTLATGKGKGRRRDGKIYSGSGGDLATPIRDLRRTAAVAAASTSRGRD